MEITSHSLDGEKLLGQVWDGCGGFLTEALTSEELSPRTPIKTASERISAMPGTPLSCYSLCPCPKGACWDLEPVSPPAATANLLERHSAQSSGGTTRNSFSGTVVLPPPVTRRATSVKDRLPACTESGVGHQPSTDTDDECGSQSQAATLVQGVCSEGQSGHPLARDRSCKRAEASSLRPSRSCQRLPAVLQRSCKHRSSTRRLKKGGSMDSQEARSWDVTGQALAADPQLEGQPRVQGPTPLARAQHARALARHAREVATNKARQALQLVALAQQRARAEQPQPLKRRVASAPTLDRYLGPPAHILAGARVAIRSPADGAYHKGRIVEVEDGKGSSVQLAYDSGMQDRLVLAEQKFAWLAPRAASAGASPALHSAMLELGAEGLAERLPLPAVVPATPTIPGPLTPKDSVGWHLLLHSPAYGRCWRALVLAVRNGLSHVLYEDGEDEWVGLEGESVSWVPRTPLQPGLQPGQQTPTGMAAVGWRISVYWQAAAAFFTGTVNGFCEATGHHQVCYTDGTHEQLELAGTALRWLLAPPQPGPRPQVALGRNATMRGGCPAGQLDQPPARGTAALSWQALQSCEYSPAPWTMQPVGGLPSEQQDLARWRQACSPAPGQATALQLRGTMGVPEGEAGLDSVLGLGGPTPSMGMHISEPELCVEDLLLPDSALSFSGGEQPGEPEKAAKELASSLLEADPLSSFDVGGSTHSSASCIDFKALAASLREEGDACPLAEGPTLPPLSALPGCPPMAMQASSYLEDTVGSAPGLSASHRCAWPAPARLGSGYTPSMGIPDLLGEGDRLEGEPCVLDGDDETGMLPQLQDLLMCVEPY